MKLNEVKTADLFAVPPGSWWARRVCQIIGAKTFHWGMFIAEDDSGWIVTESLSGKGVTLSRFDYPMAYIYRMKKIKEVNWQKLISLVADYGPYPYDWEVAFRTAIWWLLRHYLGKAIRVIKDRVVNCQEWVVLVACELGVRVIADDEYPMCTNLENSPYLEELGEVEP